MYKPEKIFQSETSDEVEAAWDDWIEGRLPMIIDPDLNNDKTSLQIEHDHLLVLPTERTKDRLPITTDAFLDPGHSVYGLAVYHQMHCLNHIRKTFYGDRFFQNQSIEMVQFHKSRFCISYWWKNQRSIQADCITRSLFRYASAIDHVQCRHLYAPLVE